MNTIFLIGIVQAVFFAFLIFNKKEKTLADKVLGIWLLYIGLHLLLAYADSEKWYLDYPHLLAFAWPFPLAQGPFFFIYVLALVRNPSRLDVKDLLHFLPFVAAYLISWEYYSLPGPEKLPYFRALLDEPNLPFRLISFLVNITGFVYAAYILWKVRLHRKNIQRLFSFTEEIDLKWIRNLAYGMLGIWLVVWFSNIAHAYSEFNLDISGNVYIFTAVTLFVFAIGYFGLKQTRIFMLNSDTLAEEAIHPEESKYQKSGLKNFNAKKLEKRLTDFMENEKPYLQPKISLSELALSLEMSPHHLSQLINEQLKQSFFEFINEYRVEAFKQALLHPPNRHLTLLAIAEDCGFNSKSSFNRIFKEMTRKTPSQYAKEVLPKE